MYGYGAAHGVAVDGHGGVFADAGVYQRLGALLQVLVVAIPSEALAESLLYLFHINAHLLHALLATFLQLGDDGALVADVGHPAPPFGRELL